MHKRLTILFFYEFAMNPIKSSIMIVVKKGKQGFLEKVSKRL